MALNRAKFLESADKLVRAGKIDEAIKQYMALSEDNPRDVNTINRIGDLYVRQRKNKEAIRQFMRIADFYASDGFHLKAIAMYKKITKLDPSHGEANERLADLYAKQGLVIEARTQFMGLAEQYLKAGQKPKAVEIYEKILAMEPDNLKVRVILADLLGKEGDPDKAVDGFLSAAADLRGRGMQDEALKILVKALRLQPARPEIHAQILEILRASEKSPKDILTPLQQLHQANPGNPGYLGMLAETYLNLDRVADFEKLKQSAKEAESRLVLAEAGARFRHSRGESDAALADLLAASEEAVRDLGPSRGAALLEEALKIRPDHLPALEKLLDVWTTASEREEMAKAAERLARLLCQTGEWERAAQVLDRLQELAPENPAMAELRPKVDSHRGVGALTEPAEAAPAGVPTLDELEKVVELDSGTEEDEGEGLFAELEESVPLETGDDSSEAPEEPGPVEFEEASSGEAGPGDPHDSDDDSIGVEIVEDRNGSGEEQDQHDAYAGKSVIQEMRGEAPSERVDEDFLAEHFTEAEVFLKYGLAEKAREQLQAILSRYPDHIPSLKKMKEIHAEEGKKTEAAAVLMKVVEIHRSRGEEEQAREMEEQARDLDPGARSAEAVAVPPVAEAPARTEAGGAALPLDADLDLDLDLPSLSDELDVKTPLTPPPPRQPARTAAPPTPPARDEDEFSIELVNDEPEAKGEEEPAEDFDPDKASQFDFYLEQNLTEAAAEVLAGMERSAPGHPGVLERRARLAEVRPEPRQEPAGEWSGDLDLDVERAFGRNPLGTGTPVPAAEEVSLGGEDGFFDLAEELKAQMSESPRESANADPALAISSGEEASIDEIFKAFRKKVDQQVEEEDYDTRYNLGIAYKEMGLLDEAIGEFQYASRDPNLFLECCSILGICFKEKGMTDLAIKWYQKALESTGHSEDRYQGLRYDLGDLYVEKGDFPQALSFFSEVYGVNSNYRNVASRIRELRKRIG